MTAAKISECVQHHRSNHRPETNTKFERKIEVYDLIGRGGCLRTGNVKNLRDKRLSEEFI